MEERESFFLSPSEEKILLMSYECHLKDFCRKFQPPMPRYVQGTALHYLKRFYVNNSIMDYPPKEILSVNLNFATSETISLLFLNF